MSSFKSSIASRCFGKFASCEFVPFFQKFVNRVYVRLMKVDMSEFDTPASYPSLNALFTRALKAPREFDTNDTLFISPCDSFISECGKIEMSRALQVKGHAYRVKEFLGSLIEEEKKERLKEGTFLNFYLSPKDYHRYHVPTNMQVTKAVHIPGKLYPVNFTWLNKVEELFIENERVVLECYSEDKKLFYMVFVGALNVGKMLFHFDVNIQTNVKKDEPTLYEYENLHLKKGEELGMFQMGSTIVMLFEKDSVELTCKKDNSIRYTDVICEKK